MAFMMYSAAPFMSDFIIEKKYSVLIASQFVINFMNCFIQISAEAWVVTLFDEKTRGKGVIAHSVGMMVGSFITNNVFVTLNSVTWINAHIFKENPRKVKNTFLSALQFRSH